MALTVTWRPYNDAQSGGYIPHPNVTALAVILALIFSTKVHSIKDIPSGGKIEVAFIQSDAPFCLVPG